MSTAQVLSDRLILIQTQNSPKLDDIMRKATIFFINMVENIPPLLSDILCPQQILVCISVPVFSVRYELGQMAVVSRLLEVSLIEWRQRS